MKYRIILNEGGKNGFVKNTPDGKNEFVDYFAAVVWIETYLQKKLQWDTDWDRVYSTSLAYDGNPIVEIVPID